MRRCCAPSCRFRSSRFRSVWLASTIRAREPRLFDAGPQLRVEPSVLSAIPAAADTASSSSGSFLSARS